MKPRANFASTAWESVRPGRVTAFVEGVEAGWTASVEEVRECLTAFGGETGAFTTACGAGIAATFIGSVWALGGLEWFQPMAVSKALTTNPLPQPSTRPGWVKAQKIP